MNKLAEAEKIIENALAAGGAAIVWLTGDARSILLAHLVKKNDESAACLIFPEFWNQAQKKFIGGIVAQWNFTAYYFRPAELALRGYGLQSVYITDCVSFAFEQEVVFDDSVCGFDRLSEFAARTKLAPRYLWDTTFSSANVKITPSGVTEMLFPLTEWTDKEVADAYRELGLPPISQNTREFTACLNCFKPDALIYCPQLKTEI